MADAAPFLHLLKLLRVPGETLRIAWADDHQFKAPPLPYEQIPEFLEHAEKNSLNVWFEVQPSAYAAPEGRSKAGDITRLAAIYADIDYKPMPGGMGSHAGATDLIHDLTGALGAPPAAIVYSGHGAQPYWLISDGEIGDDDRNRVASILRRFGGLVKQFAVGNHGDVDNVFDLPRILRVPGSTNWKKRDAPIPTSVEFNPNPVTFSLEEIEQVLDDYEVPDVDIEVGIGIVSPEAAWEWADVDCDFAFTMRREISDSVPHSRHHWALKQAALIHGLIRNGCVTEATFYELRDLLVGKFDELCRVQQPVRQPAPGEVRAIIKWGLSQAEAWTEKKLAEETRQHVHGDFALGFRTPAEGVAPQGMAAYQAAMAAGENGVNQAYDAAAAALNLQTGEITPSNVTNLHDRSRHDPAVDGNLALALQVSPSTQERMFLASMTDTGNAERLAHHLRGQQIYVTPGMGWHDWDGSRYVPDTSGTVMERTKDLFMEMLQAAREPDTVKWAKSSLNQARLNATIRLAQTVPHLVTSTMDLDANGYELCTPGGIVDLWSSTLRPADPLVDRHTYRTAYTPDFEMPTPRWDAFLRWAMGEEAEGDPLTRVHYLQRLAGAAAIGKLLWHVFPIGVGVGANGKTTFQEVLIGAFGDYGTVMPKRFLEEKRNAEHPTEIAQLRGVRFAAHSEVSPRASFDEQLVKMLTGEPRLRGRFVNENFFTFPNQTTHFLVANHLPTVQVGGTGFFRRVRKIDFRNQMPTLRQNERLVSEMLDAEGPGIMAWIIRGAKAALLAGENAPLEVLTATREYQLEEDAMARFLDETVMSTEAGPGIQRDILYSVYRQWCSRISEPAIPFTKWQRDVVLLWPGANQGTRGVFTGMALRAHQYVEETEA